MKRRPLAAIAIAALLVVPLAACSNTGNGSEASPSIQGDSMFDSAGASPEIARDSSSTADPGQIAGQTVIRTGDMSVSVQSAGTAADQIRQAVEMLGGYIESETLGDGSGGSSSYASFALRIPAERFDEAFARLGEIGEVLSQSSSTVDVTMQYVDLEARIGALETSIARLTELMSGAATTSELIEAESALSARQQELDSLQAQLRALQDQVAQSTIWVRLTTSSALPGGPANFWDGLMAGLDSIGKAAAGGLVVLGILLPWLALLAVVIVVVWIIVRAATRRRRAGRAAVAGGAGSGGSAPVVASAPASAAAPAPPEQPREPEA